jgi:hypothetical protein
VIMKGKMLWVWGEVWDNTASTEPIIGQWWGAWGVGVSRADVEQIFHLQYRVGIPNEEIRIGHQPSMEKRNMNLTAYLNNYGLRDDPTERIRKWRARN